MELTGAHKNSLIQLKKITRKNQNDDDDDNKMYNCKFSVVHTCLHTNIVIKYIFKVFSCVFMVEGPMMQKCLKPVKAIMDLTQRLSTPVLVHLFLLNF